MQRFRNYAWIWFTALLLAACVPFLSATGSLALPAVALVAPDVVHPAAIAEPDLAAAPVPVFTIQETSNLAYAQFINVDPNLLSLDVYAASGATNAPVMVYVHGGGWSAGDKKHVDHKPEFFTRAGYVLVSVNYRLSPQAIFPAHAYDVAAAVAWVHEHIAAYGGNPERLFLMGHSAGAHLVDLVGTDPAMLAAYGMRLSDIKAVVSLDTAAYDLSVFASRCSGGKLPDLYGATFGQNPEVWGTASPTSYIQPGQGIPPMAVLYSGDVGIGSSVKRELMAAEFARKLNEAGVTTLLDGAPEKNHNQVNEDFGAPGDGLSARVLTFLNQLP